MRYQATSEALPAGVPLTALSEEEQFLRDTVRKFAEEEIRPHVHRIDQQGELDQALITSLFEMGLMGIEIPEQYGGAGSSFFMAILAVEELSRVDGSFGILVDVQNTLVNNALLRWATEQQKEHYLPRLATDTVGAYALSEAAAGSDAFALETRAVDQGDHYLLNGRKLWTTNGAEAGLYIVFATVDRSLGYKGITAFLVERNFAGFRVGKKEDKLGIRASSTCELLLDNCRVPKENVLGEIGKGYRIAIETLNEGRIGIGGQMVGIAQGALECAIQYAKERHQFGKPIADFQAIQFQLAEMATELEAARLITYNTARLCDQNQRFTRQAAMVKYFTSMVAERITSQVVEIYGGYGYSTEYPAEKYFRDSKIGKIYEGTSNMQLQTIAKLLLKD